MAPVGSVGFSGVFGGGGFGVVAGGFGQVLQLPWQAARGVVSMASRGAAAAGSPGVGSGASGVIGSRLISGCRHVAISGDSGSLNSNDFPVA